MTDAETSSEIIIIRSGDGELISVHERNLRRHSRVLLDILEKGALNRPDIYSNNHYLQLLESSEVIKKLLSICNISASAVSPTLALCTLEQLRAYFEASHKYQLSTAIIAIGTELL